MTGDPKLHKALIQLTLTLSSIGGWRRLRRSTAPTGEEMLSYPFGVTLSKVGVPDGFSLVWEIDAPTSVFVSCLQQGQHRGGISGLYWKYSSAALTSFVVVTVRDVVKLQCRSLQRDPYHKALRICESPSPTRKQRRKASEVVVGNSFKLFQQLGSKKRNCEPGNLGQVENYLRLFSEVGC